MSADYTVYSFIALSLIVDLITNVSVFHSLLEMYRAGDRSQMIGRSVIIAAADVNGDRQVTSLDALMMRRLVLLHFQGFTTILL